MLGRLKSALNRYTVTAFCFLIIIFSYLIGMIVDYKTINKSVTQTITSVKKAEDSTNLDVVKAFISGTDSALDSAVYNRLDLIAVNGLFNRLILKQKIDDVNPVNTVYKLNNGQLTYYYPDFGVRIAHKNIKVLNQYCESVGTKLLYVQAPIKIDKYDNQLPHGLPDYPNGNADKFLAGLDTLGIDYLDFREVIHDAGFVYKDLFFNTDHHWTTETGFWAYQYLMNYLGENYGLEYDEANVDEDNFTFVTMKDSFIGSLANRVGTLYAGVDDFTYIYPNFDTDFEWTRYNEQGVATLTRTGDFTDTVMFKERTENADLALAYRDNIYFNGNPAIAKITNNNVEDGRVLVIQDSFGKPVSAFLSLNFHQTDVMDLRDYAEMTVLDYLKANEKYDYIIILYNPSAFKTSTYYSLFKFYNYK